MKPAHQSEQRVSSLEEKLLLSRYSNSPLDDIDADFSSIRPNMPPHWRVAWMLGQEAPGGASAPRAARATPLGRRRADVRAQVLGAVSS